MAPQTQEKTTKTEATSNGPRPSEQALQAVDVAVGAVPTVAENVRTTADTWRKSETRSKEIETLQKRAKSLRNSQGRTSEVEALRKRLGAEIEKAEAKGGDVRRQVTDQLIGQARKARERVEPVYRERVEPVVKERVEPVYRDRVEPIVKERVEPVYRKRVEPAVNRVRERI
ncbi:MAG: hypothetical protein ACJ75Z_10455 [Solirubrobacterales bacterium]